MKPFMKQATNLFPLNLRCFGANCALSQITRFCAIFLAQICVRAIFSRFSISVQRALFFSSLLPPDLTWRLFLPLHTGAGAQFLVVEGEGVLANREGEGELLSRHCQ